MSVDLKRLQQLAEAVGWEIEPADYSGFVQGYWIRDKSGNSTRYDSLAPIRERLEAEYRKLAVDVDRLWLLRYKVEDKVPCYEHSFGYDTFTAIADELAVKEPTMVERLRDIRGDMHDESRLGIITDALIDLYERMEKK